MKQVCIFEKREIALKEDNENIGYAQPTKPSGSVGTNNIGDAINNVKKNNPTSDGTIVNTGDFDNDATDNIPTFAVNATDGNMAEKEIQQQLNDPKIKNLGDVRFKVNFVNSSKEYDKKLVEMRNNSITFKKSELDNFLRTL